MFHVYKAVFYNLFNRFVIIDLKMCNCVYNGNISDIYV